MSSEELKKKVKTHKFLTGILIGLVLMMCLVVFIPDSEEGSIAFKVLPIAFLPLVVVNIMNLRKLNEELKSR